MNFNKNIVKARVNPKQLLREQELQNKIRRVKEHLQELESLRAHSSNQNIATSSTNKAINQSQNKNSSIYKNENNNSMTINKNHASYKPYHYQPLSHKEDVYHTLLTLGLKQDNDPFSDNKRMKNVGEIIDILKHYNTLAYTMDTLTKTQSEYQIINTPFESKPSHFDMIYKDPKNGATEKIRNSWDIQQAKYCIENALWDRIMETSYYTWNLQAMPFYNSLPKPLRSVPHAGPMILVWLLHHYGFDNIINKVMHINHSFWHKIFGITPKYKIYHETVDKNVYPYLGSTESRQPAELDNCEGPNREAFFDLSELMGVSEVHTPPDNGECCDDEYYPDDCD